MPWAAYVFVFTLFVKMSKGASSSNHQNAHPNWQDEMRLFDFHDVPYDFPHYEKGAATHHPSSYEVGLDLDHTGDKTRYAFDDNDNFDWKALEEAMPSNKGHFTSTNASLSLTDWNDLTYRNENENDPFLDNFDVEEEDPDHTHEDLMTSPLFTTEEASNSNVVQNQSKSERKKYERKAEDATPYWRSLRRNLKKRKQLITNYAEMTTYNGQQIHRSIASTRLRQRCTENIANDLLSSDIQRRLVAKHHIDAAVKKTEKEGFISKEEKEDLIKIIREYYGTHCRKAALNVINTGFQALSNERRLAITAIVPKTPNMMSSLAKELYNSYLKVRCSRIDHKKSTETSKAEGVAQTGASYWMLVPREKQDAILQTYMAATSCPFEEAWTRLDARCSVNLASALQSNDNGQIAYAVTVLGKTYSRSHDILTKEEKDLLQRELASRYNYTKHQFSNIYSMAIRKMSEEEKTDVREDIRMDDSRFIPLTREIVEKFKYARTEFQRAWRSRNQQAKAS